MNNLERAEKISGLIPFGFKPFAVILSFVLLSLLGFIVMPFLPLKLYPSESGQQIFINYYIPGYKPNVVEMEVTAPIESVISLIEGIEKIESTSGEGLGEIVVEVKKRTDADKVKRLIITAIRQIYPKLPQSLFFPTVSSVSQDDYHKKQLLVYTLWSDKPNWEIKEIASDIIIPQLTSLEGIASVEIQGASELIWQIRINPIALQNLGLSPDKVATTLKSYVINEGVGQALSVKGNGHNISLAGPGITANDLATVPIALVNGRIIQLCQVAKVEQVQRDTEKEFRINGKPAVYLVISSTPDANQIKLANKIYGVFESIKNDNQGISFSKIYDSTQQLRIDLRKNILRTLSSLALLLIFVLLAYRKLRYLLIISFSLLTNIAIASLLYFLFKIEIHLFSLSGFALSLGLIIDNTLVTLDHLRDKKNMKIFTALLAATLTTIAVLVSIFFMKGKLIQNLIDFAWVIIINLSVSLAIALFFIPALFQAYPVLKKGKKNNIRKLKILAKSLVWYEKYCCFAIKHKRWGMALGLWAIGIPVFLLPNKIESKSVWAEMYNKTIGSDTYQYTLKPIADKALGGSLRLFYNSTWANHAWEIPERTKLTVVYKLPDGVTLEQADAIARIFESHIQSTSGVESFTTNVNRKRGTLEIYFSSETETSTIPFELKAKLERLSLTQAAADFYIYGVGLGFSSGTSSGFANSIIILKGYSYKLLMAYAKQFADSISKSPRVNAVWITGGEQWLFSDKDNKYASFSSEPLLLRKIDKYELFQDITGFTGNNSWYGWLPIGGKVHGVKIISDTSLPSEFEFSQHVTTLDSVNFRLGNITSFNSRKIADNIFRENQQYIITLAYNFIGPDKLVEKELKKNLSWIKSSLPVGFIAKTPYSNWFSERDMWSYYLIGVMLLLIYIISAVLFESLVQPLAVITLIPLSYVGTFLTYWLFDLPFDQGTIAAFILLGGLVVNSVIYILNEQNNLGNYISGSSRVWYLKALRNKFIPILLTILSTVFGLLPFVVFGEEPFWYSLAIGTIGGLSISVIILLIFMPVLPGVFKNNRI
ncbi:MAG TPA: efflux RND transporter permease subunit [Bacteroidales bacterium]|nr:efflux RND transporter permease subunit [Bacteroidales bacterium]